MTRCTFCDNNNPADTTHCTNCGAELPGSLEAGHKSLDDTLTDLIQTGQKIEAVKQYRERTGSGLKEAQDAVEALERGEQLPTPKAILTTVDQDVVSLVREGKKNAAIKLYRDKTGVELAEAKAAVEALATEYGVQARGSGCASVLLFLVVVSIVAYLMTSVSQAQSVLRFPFDEASTYLCISHERVVWFRLFRFTEPGSRRARRDLTEVQRARRMGRQTNRTPESATINAQDRLRVSRRTARRQNP